MKNSTYWRNRFEDIAKRQNNKADTYIVELERQYKKALASIQKDLGNFYGRYANAEGIDMATARRLLTNAEKEMWEVSLEEYRRMALDEQFKKQIESMYSKSRVSRLQALQTQIRVNIEVLHSNILEDGTDLLKDTFTDTYYRTVYEIEKGTGIATNFARFNEEAVVQIISKPWKYGNFSSNWDNCKRNLLDELETTLTQAFIRGDSMDKVIKSFAKRMNVDKKRAARIVLTEHSFIANEATFTSYKETGVTHYEYLATLDLHTSEICQSMDGKVFKLSEKTVGVNYPPLHPWCRSTTIPYFDDLDTWIDERASRDPVTGKTKNVFADIKYSQWYEDNVVGLQKVKQYENELDDWLKGITTKNGYRYKADGTILITDDWKGQHKSIPRKYKPYAVIESNSVFKNGVEQIDRTLYNKDAMMEKQIHTNHHNKPKQHLYGNKGEHMHIYQWDEKGNSKERITLEIDIDDRNAHKDILGGE